jgi:hypothetical protein
LNAGTVADNLSAINLRRLEHDAGFGFSLWLGVHTMLRMDFAFSNGEGFRSRPFEAGF